MEQKLGETSSGKETKEAYSTVLKNTVKVNSDAKRFESNAPRYEVLNQTTVLNPSAKAFKPTYDDIVLNPSAKAFEPSYEDDQLNPSAEAFEPIHHDVYDGLDDNEVYDEVLDDVMHEIGRFYPNFKDCKCCKGMVDSCSGEICASLDGCVCLYDPTFTGSSYVDDLDDINDDGTDLDTWIPSQSKCICCKGYVYRCNGEICEKQDPRVCACMSAAK